MKSLQITRVFDAPRNVVFSWWSSGEKLQQWSGCKEMTHCEVQMDFRVGGGYTQKMQIGDKGTFSITATYDEIVVPEKIVYHVNLGFAVTRVQVDFSDQAGKTKVTLKQDGFPDEMTVKIVTGGTTESLEKLESILTAAAHAIR
ncbi:MAG TPA: SRPBCC domain-containing protein [Bryobacteraceae bacterium]|nr:SRPBCC domain-containing protein [Bryobacteraceae bacterium]